jgi:periplasmic divalent cation tolerance protein
MAEDSGYIVVLVTADNEKEAASIAQALIERKKAACVNIIPGVSSLFWWQGSIDMAKESLLLIKTKSGMLDDVIRLVKEMHSSEVPEVIALPITGGSRDYLKWIDESIQE